MNKIPNFTEENIKLIKKWMEYLSNGHFGNARDIVDTYNTVFKDIKQKQNYTNCGSCLRRYVREMFNALTTYEENNKVVEIKEENNKVEEIKKENGKPKRTRRSVSATSSGESDSNVAD